MVKNYNQPTLVYVNMEYEFPAAAAEDPPVQVLIKYAFGSRLNDALRNDLGQTVITRDMIDNTFVQNLVMGPSNIKPSVARKLGAQGWDSSFCDASKIGTLITDGWDISRATGLRVPTAGDNSLMLKVPLNGISYGWIKAKEPEATQPDLSVIGVDAATLSDNLLFFGCEFPKPPRFSKRRGINASGTGASTMSTFGSRTKIGDAAVVADKWSATGGLYTASHFLKLVDTMIAS